MHPLLVSMLLALPPDVTGDDAPAGGGIGGIMIFIIPLLLLFVLMPLFNKKDKVRRKRLTGLKKHDKVLTSGGILGTVIALEDDFVTVEVAKDVRIKFKRSSVFDVVTPQEGPAKETAGARR